jgi:hypothetical protein
MNNAQFLPVFRGGLKDLDKQIEDQQIQAEFTDALAIFEDKSEVTKVFFEQDMYIFQSTSILLKVPRWNLTPELQESYLI